MTPSSCQRAAPWRRPSILYTNGVWPDRQASRQSPRRRAATACYRASALGTPVWLPTLCAVAITDRWL